MSGSLARTGCTVLLVEDESALAMLAEDVLAEAGFRVVVAMRLGEALKIAEQAALDVALLDVNLGGGTNSYPVARALRRRGVPFIFVTGYGALGLEPEFGTTPIVQKPYDPGDLLAAASQALAAA